MDTFERIDMFGPEMKIKIKGSENFKTRIGGFFTFLYLVVVTLGFIAFGRDLYERKIPNVTFTKKIYTDALFVLNSENFAFTIYNQLDDSNIENLDKKFHFYMHRFDNYKGGYDEEKYFFEKCDSKVLEKRTYLKKNYDQYYCLPKGKEIKVKGIVDFTDNSTSARLNVDFCVNGIDNRTDCIPKNETIKDMNNIIMNIILDNCYADVLNYTEPFINTIFSTEIITNPFSFSRQKHFFKMIEFNTDEGLLLESFNTKTRVSIDSVEHKIMPATSNTIYSHMFINNMWKDTYKRSYIKVQGVFAFIGGFLSLSNIIFKFFCNSLIFPDIIHIFTLQYKGKSRDDINISKSEINVLINVKSSFKSNIMLDNVEVNNEPKKYKEFKKFNFLQNLCRFSPFKTKLMKERMKDLEFYDNMLRKKFSIEHMSGIFRKIKLFENILFERQTIELMKYCNLQKNNKNVYSYDELYNQVKMKSDNGNDFEKRISKNLINLLKY